MPTSRYWLQAPCWINDFLEMQRFGGAGFQVAQVVANQAGHFVPDRAGGVHVAARAFLDDAFQHGDGEGDAGGLDRLEVDRCRAATGGSESRVSGRRVGEQVREGADQFRRAARKGSGGVGASQRSRMVG